MNNSSEVANNGKEEKYESKKIDNRVLTPKEKVNSIDERLDSARKRIQELADIQETVDSIAKNMNKCIDLLAKSVKGPTVGHRLNAMFRANKRFLTKATANIEEQTMETRKQINELYKEKDKILKEERNNFNKNEEEELKKRAEELKIRLENNKNRNRYIDNDEEQQKEEQKEENEEIISKKR